MQFSLFKVHISGDSNPDPPDNGKLCYPSQKTLRRPLSLPSRSSLAGKTVFVPGAGRGVGEHITGSAGASCIGILGRDKTRIESAKDRFAGECPGTAFVAYTADIVDEDAIIAVFKDFGAQISWSITRDIFPMKAHLLNRTSKRGSLDSKSIF